jgi:hypothetical protein
VYFIGTKLHPRHGFAKGFPHAKEKPNIKNPFTSLFFGEKALVEGVAANEAHLLNAKRNPSATLALRSG